jgi:hypothetical protein
VRCCKLNCSCCAFQATQPTNMRIQPMSRLEAIAILRNRFPGRGALGRPSSVRCLHQLYSDTSELIRTIAYGERELPQSGQGLIVFPGSFWNGIPGYPQGCDHSLTLPVHEKSPDEPVHDLNLEMASCILGTATIQNEPDQD